MYLQYGNYSHASGEVDISISTELQRSPTTGLAFQITKTWHVKGMLSASDPNDPTTLTAAIVALESAYSQDGLTAQLLFDNGTATAHSLTNSPGISTVRIAKPPSFPGGPGDYATVRRYELAIEQVSLATGLSGTGGDARTIEFTETVTISGGGPRWGLIEVLEGPPIQQFYCQQTILRGTQTGRIVNIDMWPNEPDPLWPAWYQKFNSFATREAPVRTGSGQTMAYPLTYSYVFESPDDSLFGDPGTPEILVE